MDISRDDRLELNALSKEVFGSNSRWQTIMRRGQLVLISESFERKFVYSPGAKGRAGRPQKTKRRSNVLWHTYSSIKAYMIDEKAKMEALKLKAEAKVNETNSKT